MTLPVPAGWFALGSSAELAPGAVGTRRVGPGERVLFRDAAGRVTAVDPHCPHLGAHLGHGGQIVDDVLVCPFHGLRFDRTGACVATPTGHRPPRTARLATHPVVESGGFVFSWFHPDGAAPAWSPPVLDTEGWGALRTHAVVLRTHPQETTENSVDLGHFPVVHGYRDVRLLGIEVDGPHLETRYTFVRPDGLPLIGRDLQVEIHVHVWGLGFSYVDVTLPRVGIVTRQFVLPTPITEQRTELRLGMTLRRTDQTSALVRWWPRWLFDGTIGRLAMRGYVGDVMCDRAVWENKVHVERPALTELDGPIGQYRRWCRQFYAS